MKKINIYVKLLILVSLIFTCSYSKNNNLSDDAPQIFKAMEAKDYNRIDNLLKNGISPCEQMKQKYKSGIAIDFAFNYAIGTGDKKIVKLYLPYIDNITRISCSYSLSITYALINDDTDMIKFLIENGADINFITTNAYTETAIQEALLRKKIKTAQFLIDNGASLKNKVGFNALNLAIEQLLIENINFLIKNNVNLNYQDKNGNTALHIMAKGSIDKKIKNLEKFINSERFKKRKFDKKEMKESLKNLKFRMIDYTKIAKLLLKNGANINLKNNNGKTSLILAKENKINIMIKVLKK